MRPDAVVHFVPREKGQADYLRQLVAKIQRRTDLTSQRAIADTLRIPLRTFVDYLTGASEAPYTVQYALERLAVLTTQERQDALAEDEAFQRVAGATG